jgi:hypothetical protein
MSKGKRIVSLLIGALSVSSLSVHAQGKENRNLGEVDTVWRGIRYEIFGIERMPENRLIVGVRIVATSQAPASGTFIGLKVPISVDASKADTTSERYSARPLSLASSQMIDEETQRRYPALSPTRMAGKSVLPGVTLSTLRPGQAEVLSVQFAVPPQPPSSGGTEKQTVSILLPSAKGPITKVRLPPPSESTENN